MRIHVLQHVPFEGTGNLPLRAAQVSTTRFWQAEAPLFPEVATLQGVIALGGPMSVNDEHLYPWLRDEKQFIRAVVEAGIPFLGICLGAQLLANAFGATVYPNAEREIGWFPVTLQYPGLPKQVVAFHWHGETFDLPAGATLWAKSEACQHQAFSLGERAVGLQFHLETTPESAAALVTQCGDELAAGGPYVQTAQQILAAPADAYAAIQQVMTGLVQSVMGWV